MSMVLLFSDCGSTIVLLNRPKYDHGTIIPRMIQENSISLIQVNLLLSVSVDERCPDIYSLIVVLFS